MVGFGKEYLCNFRSHGTEIGHRGIEYTGNTQRIQAITQVKIRDNIKFGNVRTPLCKISSTGEIEQRFRLN